MVDFLMIAHRMTKSGMEVYPRLKIRNPSSDLMIQGGDFYAIWLEDTGLWSKNEQDALDLIDRELDKYVEENKETLGPQVRVLHMWDADTGMIDRWHRFVQKQMRDSYVMLDEKLIFSNTLVTKEDYATKRLPYPLEGGDISAYDHLMSTLYTAPERHKLEWAIGAIISGDSKTIQKFIVLYGAPKTGKSTVINIMTQLFEGYYSTFDAKALGSSNASFALEAFASNPLVAIQHDGDLSRIEDNTRLNSLVAHEQMTVNEKFKRAYSTSFKSFLIMGTNKPVKITDSKSGIIRRLIDVSPSGKRLTESDYDKTFKQIKFELGAIAKHCLDVYLEKPDYYEHYVPLNMLGASNDFYNYMLDSYPLFEKEDSTTLATAWARYNTYCDNARVPYPLSQRLFKEELKSYFENYSDRFSKPDGTRVRSYYYGFLKNKFEMTTYDLSEKKDEDEYTIEFKEQESVFDRIAAGYLAQYAKEDGSPKTYWRQVKTTISDLDTHKLHYVKVPSNHIVIDFDIPDENGNKSFEANLKEASKWPKTYAELSKSGAGIHLHYIYKGDPSKLASIYKDHIEIKVFNGDMALRRKLTKCNDLDISPISSGLPLKGEKKTVDDKVIKNERGIRTLIKKNLNKEYHPSTKSSIDFIYKILEESYEGGVKYDVSDMMQGVLAFAANSKHNSDYCIKLVSKMKFKSEEPSKPVESATKRIAFFDVETFPNLFLVCYKEAGEGKTVFRLFNPKPEDIEDLLKYDLVGFNNRKYDNHMLYGCLQGNTPRQQYELSQNMILYKTGFFGEAYNLSMTDIYDFAASTHKQSLKKFEIEMGEHHQELGLPWDQPVPENKWEKVAEYCENDVLATEKTFYYLRGDWVARQILSDITGKTPNDTTNTITTELIFRGNKHPQGQFNYRNLGADFPGKVTYLYDDPYSKFIDGVPVFPGYKYENGVSSYRDVDKIGEGGRVYAKPGIYYNVALLDIASMHPHSIIAENLFGDYYTKIFKDLVDTRVAIKHEDWDAVRKAFDGKLSKYVDMVERGELSAKELAGALKTAINSVYGLTAAKFDNEFRDPRNVDNIVAKRGALFMINLQHLVEEKGFTVAHIKTDSIKIPNATPDIIKFVMDYGKAYGYTFEHEATYERMCLVNDAVYIAKYKEPLFNKQTGKNDIWWTATGTQFKVPYVFKTLFSKEKIEFGDLCQTFEVKAGAIYLDSNENLPDGSNYEKEYSKLDSKVKKMRKDGLEPGKDILEQMEELKESISHCHNYRFIGRVGAFCPIRPGMGGGILVRINNDKPYAVQGTTGYRWLESEVALNLGIEERVDMSFFENLANEAKEAINNYGDGFEAFVNGPVPAIDWSIESDDDLPF